MHARDSWSKSPFRSSRTRAIAPNLENPLPSRARTLSRKHMALAIKTQFGYVTTVLVLRALPMPETVVTRLTSQVANIDAALVAFRDWLPTHGFKLVVPPPTAVGVAHAFASVWHRGEALAISHKGPTAALALLRAAEFELVKLYGASTAAACGRCHGLGWFVTKEGMVEICRHAEGIKLPVG